MLKNGSLKFLDNLCSQREKLYFQPILTTQKLHELLSFKKAQSQQPSCNVTVEEDIQQCVAKTVAAFGGISTLVNNVGWGKAYDDPLEVPMEEMIESYKLNTLAATRMTSACRPYLLKAENATITNSGSLVGVLPAFDFIAYSAAKAAPPLTI